jgi:SDR family mycofactocin-dependent oxidoreductase
VSRVAIVTGAGRGIGAATVAALAADGWRVIAVDRGGDDPRLPYPMASEADLRASVAAANVVAARDADLAPVGAMVADATDEAAMAEVVAAAEEWGGLEAIVADAGVIAGGVPAWELPLEQQRAVMEVCLDGVMVAARVGIPALLRRPAPRRGRFVAVSSAAAFRGLPGLAAYCAAKAGVGGFVRGLAVDLRGSGITANAIAPGSTDTPILDESARLYGLDSAEDFAPQQPIERLLDPAEPAAMIRWLLGPEAAAVTGALLPVDGGLAL